MSTFVVGLDGGGTKVAVEVVTLDGVVRGTGTAGSCNIAAVPVEDALSAAKSAIGKALTEAGAGNDQVAAICAGLAGTSHTERAAAFKNGLSHDFPQAQIAVIPDFAIAHTAALSGKPGIVVIAGTGSIAYGESEAGVSHRAGGYGHLIDDSGSGYGVGRGALAAALRAADGSGEPTALFDALLDRYSLTSALELIPLVYGGALDRVAIAGLTGIVAEAANAGDGVAMEILTGAGEALARVVRAVHETVFSGESDVAVATTGGLWMIAGGLRAAFEHGVRQFAPNARVFASEMSPVRGAVIRALRLAETVSPSL